MDGKYEENLFKFIRIDFISPSQRSDRNEKCARIFHGWEEKAISLQFEHYIGNMIYGRSLLRVNYRALCGYYIFSEAPEKELFKLSSVGVAKIPNTFGLNLHFAASCCNQLRCAVLQLCEIEISECFFRDCLKNGLKHFTVRTCWLCD